MRGSGQISRTSHVTKPYPMMKPVLTALFVALASSNVMAESRVTKMVYSMIQTASVAYYTITTIFTFVGVYFVGRALYGFYRWSTDQNTGISPWGYVVGFFVGGLLTAVGVFAITVANTFMG